MKYKQQEYNNDMMITENYEIEQNNQLFHYTFTYNLRFMDFCNLFHKT